jgi:hypothetical protein
MNARLLSLVLFGVALALLAVVEMLAGRTDRDVRVLVVARLAPLRPLRSSCRRCAE